MELIELFTEGGLIGTVHTCIGQEWMVVSIAKSLFDGDVVFTSHRALAATAIFLRGSATWTA